MEILEIDKSLKIKKILQKKKKKKSENSKISKIQKIWKFFNWYFFILLNWIFYPSVFSQIKDRELWLQIPHHFVFGSNVRKFNFHM